MSASAAARRASALANGFADAPRDSGSAAVDVRLRVLGCCALGPSGRVRRTARQLNRRFCRSPHPGAGTRPAAARCRTESRRPPQREEGVPPARPPPRGVAPEAWPAEAHILCLTRHGRRHRGTPVRIHRACHRAQQGTRGAAADGRQCDARIWSRPLRFARRAAAPRAGPRRLRARRPARRASAATPARRAAPARAAPRAAAAPP